ncbi:HupE/UreJ family protein [Oceanibacterium hippocampi]|uniref:HupE / UreJ protein n=1 Tax=Oceanibacterium hippocampi TaxID=745714 RepID=A0A1Y5SFW1_9PROT|nr:HupE/UreJ family protein [Oceanibacterium hippocampi]SLN39486.1 HupE / UreJ protein [Oceanibacterium hippocampi]
MKKYLAGLVALGVLVSAPALAHHPLGGMPMTTFGHGLLSGVGHPLLGFDHLFFVVAVGIAALFTGRRLLAPLAFVAGMLGGVLLIVGGVALPAVEAVIALSLLLIGGLLARGKALGLPLAAVLFAGLGLFHGWAFGETIAGQEGGAPLAVTIGYLVGLAAIQWVIAVAAGFAVGTLGRATSAAALPARLSGAMVAGAGAFLLLETFEGVLFATMGVVAG